MHRLNALRNTPVTVKVQLYTPLMVRMRSCNTDSLQSNNSAPLIMHDIKQKSLRTFFLKESVVSKIFGHFSKESIVSSRSQPIPPVGYDMFSVMSRSLHNLVTVPGRLQKK